MSRTVATTVGSLERVIRTHSSAMLRDDSVGSHASRPNAYQFAWLKIEPVQLRSLPMLATPAMPVRVYPCNEPSTTRATEDPLPFRYVYARHTSSNSGPRYTRSASLPRYY